MNRVAKRTTQGALAVCTITATLAAVTATPAFAVNEVTCGPSDYLRIQMHYYTYNSFYRCFANAGEIGLGGDDFNRTWITRIETGNNRVQWYGDGRWQPETPIDKWTVFSWPNHPNGVRADLIRIL